VFIKPSVSAEKNSSPVWRAVWISSLVRAELNNPDQVSGQAVDVVDIVG